MSGVRFELEVAFRGYYCNPKGPKDPIIRYSVLA